MHSLIDHLHLPTKFREYWLDFQVNQYNTHYQYKCAIAIIWGYGILYLHFGARKVGAGCSYRYATCTWAEHGSHSAQVQVAKLLLHPAPTCAVRLAPTLYLHSWWSQLHANRCWCPVPLTFSNLRWWCFSFHQLAQTLHLHSGWLLSATCTGGLVHRSTGAYTACTDCNLHCAVVVGGGGDGAGGVYIAQTLYLYSG